MDNNVPTQVEYCLYARKSTEDDERKAMSIDSQIREMTDLAIGDNLIIKEIRTFAQSFSNNPNEKFLLMILCSQAMLENDNSGINVKRGMRAQCCMGWRPRVAPVGYLSQKNITNPQLIN
ncbi:MAG: hypothetical protein ACR2LN_01585 [Candidatus Levyibacteriota bacterium]